MMEELIPNTKIRELAGIIPSGVRFGDRKGTAEIRVSVFGGPFKS